MSLSSADPATMQMNTPADGRQRSLLLAFVAANLVIAVVALIVEGLTPTTVLFPILLAVAAFRLWRGRSAVGLLLGTGVVMLVVHVPFITAALSDACVHPFDAARPCNELLWIIYLGLAPLGLTGAAAFAWISRRRA